MMNPISNTAYYTLGVRAWDAVQAKPACGDTFASLFMNVHAQKIWSEFKDDTKPNASTASRHAIIDNQLRQVIRTAPYSRVVIIGAGFDTRCFRLKGGNWIEVDEPSIINYKESILPSSTAPNSLVRIPIEFGRELLSEKLKPFSTSLKTHIVIEGVFMYLKSDERESLITVLQKMFPNHIIYCDLMRKSFFESYSKKLHDKIVSLGASFREMSEYPESFFLQKGYTTLSSTSIPLYAAEHGNLDVPAFLIRYIFKRLRNGYAIWRLEISGQKT